MGDPAAPLVRIVSNPMHAAHAAVAQAWVSYHQLPCRADLWKPRLGVRSTQDERLSQLAQATRNERIELDRAAHILHVMPQEHIFQQELEVNGKSSDVLLEDGPDPLETTVAV